MREITSFLLSVAMIFSLARAAIAADWVGKTLDGKPCTGGAEGFGPYDYFDVDEETDPLYGKGRYWEANKVHTDRARLLLDRPRPMSQGDFQLAMSNLDYTLRAFPNDPRALQYMVEIDHVLRNSQRRLASEYPPPECYFERAIHFRPEQPHIPLLYGIYLNKRDLPEREILQYEQALRLNNEFAEAHYNLGLALAKLRRFDDALPHASKAYQLGFPLQGLRRILVANGYDIDVSTDAGVDE